MPCGRQGRLHDDEIELVRFATFAEAKPAVSIVNLDRPAALTPLAEAGAAVVAGFGASSRVLARLALRDVTHGGPLPFAVPQTAEAVVQQLERVSYGSVDPLYAFGAGKVRW